MTKATTNEFTNEVEVVGYENKGNRRIYNIIPGNYDIEALIDERVKEKDESMAIEVTVIPPFGERIKLYTVIIMPVILVSLFMVYKKIK
jgi:hypothetical protein